MTDEEKKPAEGEDEGQETAAPPEPKGRGTGSVKGQAAANASVLDSYQREIDITKFKNDVTEATKAKLAKAPRTAFILHLAPREDPKSYEVVTINGYQMAIPKGVMVNIPLPVAEILAESYRVELNAGKEMRADRAEMKDGTSVANALSQ